MRRKGRARPGPVSLPNLGFTGADLGWWACPVAIHHPSPNPGYHSRGGSPVGSRLVKGSRLTRQRCWRALYRLPPPLACRGLIRSMRPIKYGGRFGRGRRCNAGLEAGLSPAGCPRASAVSGRLADAARCFKVGVDLVPLSPSRIPERPTGPGGRKTKRSARTEQSAGARYTASEAASDPLLS